MKENCKDIIEYKFLKSAKHARNNMGTTLLDKNRIISPIRDNSPLIYNPRTMDSIFLEGPGSYKEVMGSVTQKGLLRMTTAQTFCLIDFALQNPNENFCRNILSKLDKYWFWTSTEKLWGRDTVIMYDNLDGKMPSDRESLIKFYQEGDARVRIAPAGFQSAKQSIDELVKNPGFIADIGDKSLMDVVVRVADKVGKDRIYIWAVESRKGETKRYTTLHFGGGICIAGYEWDVDRKCLAFGLNQEVNITNKLP